MQYQVPQFIETEDKIFGPLTFRQFIYVAGSAGVSIVFLLSLPFFWALVASTPFVALGLSLAFVKINNRSFINILESAFNFFIKTKTYLWKREDVKRTLTNSAVVETPEDPGQVYVPTQKIRDLATKLDIKDTTL